LNEQLNYTLPTYVFNIHYRLDWYVPSFAFTCPARLLNVDNINTMRFHEQKKHVEGYFYHFNRFLKPKELMIKEHSIAESSSTSYMDEVIFKDKRKDILKNMLGGNYDGTKMSYKDYEMPKNINLLPRFFLLNREEVNMYLNKLDDPSLDFENTYNEIINL